MISWKETGDILRRISQLTAADRPSALATVVRIEGSAYRRPGAKLLIEDDGTSIGSVSGGCLEADVRDIAQSVMRGGKPRLLAYKTGDDDESVWGLGLGCDGRVEVFLQSTQPDLRGAAGDAIAAKHRSAAEFVLVTVVAGSVGLGRTVLQGSDGTLCGSTDDPDLDRKIAQVATHRLAIGTTGIEDFGGSRVFFEVQNPPPRLLICGGGDDAMPLAAYANELGFAVTVIDHRPANLRPERFPEEAYLVAARPETAELSTIAGASTYAVVKTHSLSIDRGWVTALLATETPYVGLLGPRPRTRELLSEVSAERAARVYGPVGLDLGAEGPHQIAVSVLAEILAVRSGREPISLRRRQEAIHAS